MRVRLHTSIHKGWQITVLPIGCYCWIFRCLSPDGGEPRSNEEQYLTQEEALGAAQRYLNILVPADNLHQKLDQLFGDGKLDQNSYCEALHWLSEVMTHSLF
jgi:hypothetical protein